MPSGLCVHGNGNVSLRVKYLQLLIWELFISSTDPVLTKFGIVCSGYIRPTAKVYFASIFLLSTCFTEDIKSSVVQDVTVHRPDMTLLQLERGNSWNCVRILR